MSPLVQAAILGIVQGVTEFLPVSSTAHLLIGARLLRFDDPNGIFTVMIQLGSILAIVWLYRVKVFGTLGGLLTDGDARRFAWMIVLGTIPALVAGGLLSSFVKRVLFGSFAVIGAAWLIGGIVMLLVERARPAAQYPDAERLPFGQALTMGCAQALALIPGVSRSGGTIVAGMLAGVDRAAAFEFSFFLAMPTMAAAFAHDLWEARHSLATPLGLEIGIGFVMAFLASAIVVRPSLQVVRRAGFAPFGWYRIAIGAILLGLLAGGWR